MRFCPVWDRVVMALRGLLDRASNMSVTSPRRVVRGREVTVLDPAKFIPAKDKVCQTTAYPTPYELAWQETHSGKGLSDAIESVKCKLGVSYDMASSLVWAEITAVSPRVPS